MDLMTLAAKLVLDDSSYKSGIKDAESAGERLAGRMSSMTVAVGNIMADIVKKGFNTVKDMVGGAVNAYADYQQLIGGVETLFKSSSTKVEKYAKESFRTTGLSANQYMETVTSFSASLLQGLQGDTEAAAEFSNMAIQDMADNANKMGTSISSIQAAYQGFAKQNYTMLDNLKLGYGGTSSEMVRLINDSGILDHEIKDLDNITFDQLVAAIHKIQEEMGITGTTAKEAKDTISGSKASLKASWEDLLSAIGGEGDQDRLNETLKNFKESFSAYITNFVPTLVTTIVNSGTLIEGIAEAITTIPTDTLSKIVNGIFGVVEGAAKGGKNLATWLIESITNVFKNISADPSQIMSMGQAIGEFIGSALSDIVKNAPTIISGLFQAGVSLASSLIEGLFSGLFGTDDTVSDKMRDINDEMIDALTEANVSSTKASGILTYMEGLVQKYGDAASGTEEWAKAQGELEKVMPGATKVLEDQNTNLQGGIDKLRDYNEELKNLAIEEAKRKALQAKQDVWTEAQGKLWATQAEIDMNQSIRNKAANNLLEFFGIKGARNAAGELIDQGFDPFANKEQIYFSLMRRLEEATGGAGNQAYLDIVEKLNNPENQAQVMAWIESMQKSNGTINDLEATVGDLEKQLADAKTDYELAAAAVEDLAKAASATSQELGSIHAPNLPEQPIFTNSGEYYTWYYSHRNKPGNATGLDWVPYDGYVAELHRGEAVITKQENEKRMGIGKGYEESFEDMLMDAIENAASKVVIAMSGEKVGDLTTRRVKHNINASSNARMRSMGG